MEGEGTGGNRVSGGERGEGEMKCEGGGGDGE